VLFCHTSQVACEVSEIISKLHRRTGQELDHFPTCLKSGEEGMAKLTPLKPLCIEPFSNYPSLGRFVLRDKGQTVAVGVVMYVE